MKDEIVPDIDQSQIPSKRLETSHQNYDSYIGSKSIGAHHAESGGDVASAVYDESLEQYKAAIGIKNTQYYLEMSMDYT